MKIKKLILFAILFLYLQVSIVSAVDPIVENADAVWNPSLEATPANLTNTVSKALPRPLIEYSNTVFNFELKKCSEELADNVSKALPRPLVEYPNTALGFELKECPEELSDNTSKALPRPLVEYPNTVLSKSLIFPKELINDTTPPIITNISIINITENSATIKWDTDEIADSLVKYGKVSGVYTQSEEKQLFVKNHTIELIGLLQGTCYYFVVNSTDRSGNSAESSEYTFTTTGVPNKPIISISTDKHEYTAGDTMSINITISNPTEEGQSVYFAWRLDLPDYDLQYWIMKKSLYLPPDYKRTFTIPFTLGDYRITFNASWYVALYNTTTLEVISEDTADWQYVSGAKARGKAIPEEIAKEIIKTAEIEEVELPN